MCMPEEHEIKVRFLSGALNERMNMDSKYLTVNLVEKKEKTDVYDVVSYLHNVKLGEIKWFSHWRTYAFFLENDTVWNVGCLNDIVLFINTLMEKRKVSK